MRSEVIKPAKKIVVLKKATLSGVSKSTIEVVSDKQPEMGEVIAVGDGKQPIQMKKGDIVAYRQFGQSAMFVGSQEYLFVSFADILAVICKK